MEKEQPQVRDLRNGDWFWTNNLVHEHPYLTASAKVVYSALAFFANNKTQKAYPSINKLSESCKLNKSTIIKSIKQLENYCFIGSKKTEGKVSHYTLLKLTDSQLVEKVNQSIKRNGGFKIGNGGVVNRDTNNTYITKLNNNKTVNLNNLKRLDEMKTGIKNKSIIDV